MKIKKESDKFAASSVFEGMVSIRAVLHAMDASNSDRRITTICYDRAKASARRREIGYLRAVAPQYGYTLVEKDASEIDAMTIGNSHGGIVAVCTDRTIPQLTETSLPENGFFVMLDGIEDPYNFGYAVRSIYAAGADGIVLSPRNWMTAAGVVARASAGASELIALYIADGADAVRCFAQNRYRIICADLPDSVPVWEADLHRPLLLVVGGEKRGISRELLNRADCIVRLDYGREFPAALSAASAASILSYEVFRQNRA